MKRWTVVLIGLLLVFSLACSLGARGRTDDPAVDDEPAVTEPGVTEPGVSEPVVSEPDADDDAFTVDRDALDRLNSYRARMTWRIEEPDGSVEEIIFEHEATRDPRAERFSMTSDGEGMEVITVAGSTYMRWGDEWMQTTSSEDEIEQQFGDFLISGDALVGDIGRDEYRYQGRETINGVRTRHYQADYTPSFLLGGFWAADDISNVKSATIDVWVADESGLPRFTVRYVMSALWEDADGREGSMLMSQDVYDVNQPFTIEAPEGASGGLPDGVPLYPGATGLTTFGSMTLFESEDDASAVWAFYTDALEAAGWVRTDSSEFGTMYMDVWEKDGQTLNLTITGDDGGGANVMVSLE